MTRITDKILAEKADGIGWLIFNHPERRNAMNLEMWQKTAVVLDDFESDPNIRVVVLRGAGGKSFVSGADISQFEAQRGNAEQAEIYANIARDGKRRISTMTKPMIAMIQGYCIGGGLSIAMNADLRVASRDSQFAIPAAKLGIAYDLPSLERLVNLVGPSAAKEILFLGRRFDAEKALRIGLLDALVEPGELESTVRDMATEIAGNAPLTIRAAKLTIENVLAGPEARDVNAVEAAIRACFDSNDYAAGRRAFMEKRKPVFTGT